MQRREDKSSQKGVPWKDGNVVSKSGVELTTRPRWNLIELIINVRLS